MNIKKLILPLIIILCLVVSLTGIMADYTSQYPTQDHDHVKATNYEGTSGHPYYATDSTKSLTGTWLSNSWMTDVDAVVNRFHIDLGSAKVIRRIYYENGHSVGDFTGRGVENFTFWGSNTGAGTFDDLVYANDEGWTQLTISQSTFDQHAAADEADPKYITVTNSVSYRYYAFKFADNWGGLDRMNVRRIELQTEDGYIPPVTDNAIFFGMNF